MINLDCYELIEPKELSLIYASGSESIGENLLKLRKKNNFSRIELADRLNVCLSTVSKYEQGTRIPDIDTLIDISNVFEVDLDKLIR